MKSRSWFESNVFILALVLGLVFCAINVYFLIEYSGERPLTLWPVRIVDRASDGADKTIDTIRRADGGLEVYSFSKECRRELADSWSDTQQWKREAVTLRARVQAMEAAGCAK